MITSTGNQQIAQSMFLRVKAMVGRYLENIDGLTEGNAAVVGRLLKFHGDLLFRSVANPWDSDLGSACKAMADLIEATYGEWSVDHAYTGSRRPICYAEQIVRAERRIAFSQGQPIDEEDAE